MGKLENLSSYFLLEDLIISQLGIPNLGKKYYICCLIGMLSDYTLNKFILVSMYSYWTQKVSQLRMPNLGKKYYIFWTLIKGVDD